MCGIAGYIDSRGCASSLKVIHRMTAEIAHRGPDGCGTYADGHAVLGHRRLSIVDLKSGHQPMFNEDGNISIVYNGEIFNHAAIRPRLEIEGHRYHSTCDTETVIHAYEQYGASCVDLFRGMFSFGIWDKPKQTLFCARDRMGIKPFYYFWNGPLFVFASEVKALLRHPAIHAELEGTVLPEYLALGYINSDKTMFRNIRKLMPGHSLTVGVRDGGLSVEVRRYWDVPRQSASATDGRELIEECRGRLEENTRMRMMSDVPLGVFLSGGLDSSTLAALMQRMSPNPIKTFSVGYENPAYSELTYAQRVASVLGTDHRTVTIDRDQFFAALPRVIWHEDEPAVFSSSVPLYFVSKLASEHVKVVLGGEGSDELFGGYERYSYYGPNASLAKAYGLLPAAFRTAVTKSIGTTALISGDLRRKLQHTFVGRENTFESLQLENFYAAFGRSEIGELRREHKDVNAPFDSVLGFWLAREGCSTLDRLLYTDQKTYLTELLMRQDQMSMAWSVESRVPFLDHTFVEFAMSIPDRFKIRGGERKYVLKRAAEGLLPPEIIRRKKMGFATPLRLWFENPTEPMVAKLTARDGFLSSILDVGRIRTLLKNHGDGKEDATDRIWRLLNLQMWGDMFFQGTCEAPELANYFRPAPFTSAAAAT